MIQDLHSHTRYSNCGRDEPEQVIEKAIEGGIELLGITDHNYGIGSRKKQYLDELAEMQSAYKGKIRILRGIELSTLPGQGPEKPEDIAPFDYCLIEHIDYDNTVLGTGVFDYARSLSIPAGIAHTDLFGFAEKLGEDAFTFIKKFADCGIFWEMNVNYDSIHKYREHEYVKRFRESKEQQEIVRRAGLRIAVGFDGHRVEDYLAARVKDMNRFLEENGIARMFEDLG